MLQKSQSRWEWHHCYKNLSEDWEWHPRMNKIFPTESKVVSKIYLWQVKTSNRRETPNLEAVCDGPGLAMDYYTLFCQCMLSVPVKQI